VVGELNQRLYRSTVRIAASDSSKPNFGVLDVRKFARTPSRNVRIADHTATMQMPGKIWQMDESAHSRQRRLQLLVRQNRGRTEFRTYIGELAGVLEAKIADSDRLDLQTTDQLFAAHVNGRQESTQQPQRYFQKTWTYMPIRVWSGECARIGAALRGIHGILFVGPYKYCGAIKVDSERALQVAQSLLDFDGDTLSLGTLEGSSGLYLDKFEEHSEWFVEFVVWGEWSNLIAPVIAG
jgi:hypothetical protein